MTLPDAFDLSGQCALVTGGAGHLGTAMARALAQAGATVVLASRDLRNLKETASRIVRETGQEVRAMALDVTRSGSVEKCFRKLGRLNILVNNALASPRVPPGAPPSRAHFPPEADWKTGLDGALGQVFRVMRAAMPLLRRSAPACVINLSTMYALVSPDHRIYQDSREDSPAYYGAAKAGLLQLTRYWARLLGPEGIRVNALTPGPFPKPEVQRSQPALMRRLAGRVPLGRLGAPEDLTGAVVFLASRASGYMTGQNLVVDGGWTA